LQYLKEKTQQAARTRSSELEKQFLGILLHPPLEGTKIDRENNRG